MSVEYTRIPDRSILQNMAWLRESVSFKCSYTSCFQHVPTTTTVTTMVNVSTALTGPTACVVLRLQESTVKHVGSRVSLSVL